MLMMITRTLAFATSASLSNKLPLAQIFISDKTCPARASDMDEEDDDDDEEDDGDDDDDEEDDDEGGDEDEEDGDLRLGQACTARASDKRPFSYYVSRGRGGERGSLANASY